MSGSKSVLELSLAELLEMDGRVLTSIREELGIPPKEMAHRLNCHHSTLNRYENGRITIPVSLIMDVKKLLDDERAVRNIHVAPEGWDEPRVASAVEALPIKLARGPLPPGTKLVELVPVVETPETVTRLFAAVNDQEAVRGEGDADGSVVVGVPSVGAAEARASPGAEPGSGARRWLMARLGWVPTAAMVLMLVVPTGCYLAHRAGVTSSNAAVGREQRLHEAEVQGELARRSVPPTWQESAAEAQEAGEAQQKPLQPSKGQKSGPCNPNRGELEVDKFCWWALDPARACPPEAVKHEGKCLLPVPESGKKPVSGNPGK